MDRETGTPRTPLPTPEQLAAIRRFDTCTIADAIETFELRLRNEGFSRPGLTPVTGPDSRALGYAATFRVTSADPPVTGGRFIDRTDWWDAIQRLPAPRIAVFERPKKAKDAAGEGSCIGEVHGAILKAFGCEGVISDGSVRDVPGLKQLDLPVFAHSVTVSHSFTHILDFGVPVEVYGLEVRPGDLLYADCHGVLSIPIAIAGRLPEVAERLSRKDREIVDLCRATDFSAEKLLEVLREEPQPG